MSIRQNIMRLGSFTVSLKPTTPQSVIDACREFNHIVVVDSEPTTVGSRIMDFAHYTGVIRSRELSDRGPVVTGSGLPFWLGDEDGKGDLYTTKVSFTDETFANVIRGLLPDSITEGTLHSVSGLFTGAFRYVTPREAIDYVTEAFDAEWRVNPDGSLDAGTADDLYGTDTPAIIVRRDAPTDLDLEALIAEETESSVNAKDYSTGVVLIGSGDDGQVVTAASDLVSTPYTDLHGNDVVFRRIIEEEATSTPTNAGVRAALHLNRFGTLQRGVKIDRVSYDFSQTVNVGEHVYLYDPANGIYDASNPVEFNGELVYPYRLRVLSVDEPILDGMGVYLRYGTGPTDYVDLTPWVIPETGPARIELNTQLPQSASGGRPVNLRTDDVPNNTTPDSPDNLSALTDVYVNKEGHTMARLTLNWDEPLNTDGSDITDGSHYRIRYKPSSETEWTYTATEWNVTAIVLSELIPNTTYDVGVQAVDTGANRSAWATLSPVTESDTVPPSQPSAPTTTPGVLTVFVRHDLTKAATGDLEADLDHLEIHASDTSGFTPDSTTLVGEPAANAAMIVTGTDVLTSFPVEDDTPLYVAVRAVDRSGNISAKSGESSVTPLLVDTPNIAADAITANEILSDTITGNEIEAGSITAGDSVFAAAAIQSADINTIEWDQGVGGTLTLGGVGDASGVLEVVDSDGIEILARINGSSVQVGPVTAGDIDAGAITSSTGDFSGTVEGHSFYTPNDSDLQIDEPVTVFPPGQSFQVVTIAEASGETPDDEPGILWTVHFPNYRTRSFQFFIPGSQSVYDMYRRGWKSSGEWSEWYEYTGTVLAGSGGAGGGQTVDVWGSSWFRSWRDAFGGQWRSDERLLHGEWESYGNHRGCIGFNDSDIRSTLSGRTIDDVRLTLKRRSAGGSSAAGSPRIGTHNIANQPASGSASAPSGSNFEQASTSWSWGETDTEILSVAIGQDLRDNNAKGIMLYDTDASPYLEFVSATLQITHSA